MTPAVHTHSSECRCYYGGCVAWWRHWHGFLPGGYDDPADPEGMPRIFDADDPEPDAVRDDNGAALPRKPKRPVDRHSLAQALPEHRYCTDHIRGHESCLAAADTILRNLEEKP